MFCFDCCFSWKSRKVFQVNFRWLSYKIRNISAKRSQMQKIFCICQTDTNAKYIQVHMVQHYFPMLFTIFMKNIAVCRLDDRFCFPWSHRSLIYAYLAVFLDTVYSTTQSLALLSGTFREIHVQYCIEVKDMK